MTDKDCDAHMASLPYALKVTRARLVHFRTAWRGEKAEGEPDISTTVHYSLEIGYYLALLKNTPLQECDIPIIKNEIAFCGECYRDLQPEGAWDAFL